jgi:hypothetical protein
VCRTVRDIHDAGLLDAAAGERLERCWIDMSSENQPMPALTRALNASSSGPAVGNLSW